MFGLFGRRRQQAKLNTLSLYGDLDDVEIVLDIEDTFGITLSDDEVCSVRSVGDMERLIRRKLEDRSDFDAVWALLEYIARIHSGSRDSIDRDTTFYAQDAKPRDL